MQITPTTPVASIATSVPASIRVFERHGIDFCCGGQRPVGEVCTERGVSFEEVASAIEAASTGTPAAEDRDWTAEPLAALLDHIIATYHRPLREELPRLETMAAKVASVHGEHAPYLTRVEDIVRELRAELAAHMGKEEVVLFPTIRAIESGQALAPRWITAPIAVMEHEHDHAGALLAELRRLTGGYTTPGWGCQTFRALNQGLEALEAAMHVHVHLENNILFPRALRAADALVHAR